MRFLEGNVTLNGGSVLAVGLGKVCYTRYALCAKQCIEWETHGRRERDQLFAPPVAKRWTDP